MSFLIGLKLCVIKRVIKRAIKRVISEVIKLKVIQI